MPAVVRPADVTVVEAWLVPVAVPSRVWVGVAMAEAKPVKIAQGQIPGAHWNSWAWEGLLSDRRVGRAKRRRLTVGSPRS